jgi:hypothetical protein
MSSLYKEVVVISLLYCVVINMKSCLSVTYAGHAQLYNLIPQVICKKIATTENNYHLPIYLLPGNLVTPFLLQLQSCFLSFPDSKPNGSKSNLAS